MNAKLSFCKLIFNIVFTLSGWISSIYAFKIDNEFIISMIAVISICYIVLQIYSYISTVKNIYVHNTKEEVNEYLYDWLNKGGRTVIFTRDLTWVNESSKIRELLEKKSKDKELSICLYRETEVTAELKRLGAQIYVHNLPENQLKSRFTIIDYGKNNSKITVGYRNEDGKFVNIRYAMNSNPNICQTYIELFELIKRQKQSTENVLTK